MILMKILITYYIRLLNYQIARLLHYIVTVLHYYMTMVSTEVTFGRGDLSVCPPGGRCRGP